MGLFSVCTSSCCKVCHLVLFSRFFFSFVACSPTLLLDSVLALLFHISFDIYFVPTCLFLSCCLIINEWMNELQCLFRFYSFSMWMWMRIWFNFLRFSFFIPFLVVRLFFSCHFSVLLRFLLILPFFSLLDKSQLNGKNVNDFGTESQIELNRNMRIGKGNSSSLVAVVTSYRYA